MHRRDFFKASALAGGSALLLGAGAGATEAVRPGSAVPLPQPPPVPLPPGLPDLSPARWIWYPSERTLPNTFILFRRELRLGAAPRRATGWLAADSRYRLEVNGRRLQWGPAPADPRWAEADPIDLTETLQVGLNVIGVTVLFFGHGDGTWPFGRPGFLFSLELEHADGAKEKLVSDAAWQAHLCTAWEPGRYKRFFIRALQERFDARLYPAGWSTAAFTPDRDWLAAMPLDGSPNKPALSTGYAEYLQDPRGGPPNAELRPRIIPLLDEPMVPVLRLAESLWVTWLRPATEYFDYRAPHAYTVERRPAAVEVAKDRWEVELTPEKGAVLTFELEEQIVGFPAFRVEAPAGTTIDLLTQEGHAVGGTALLYTTRTFAWARFICRAGENAFECFDFESLRWLQLHLQGAGRATVHGVGVRRRLFPWKNPPLIRTGEPALQRLFEAHLNSLCNAGIDQYVDGNGRERQQYAGECAHQVYLSLLVFGDPRLPARYLGTWSQGMTKEGYFLDCWPAYDRLARLGQREIDVFHMGTILDHAVQFIITAWRHYLYTGDLEPLREPYPRLVRFANYLIGHIDRDHDGLLPVINLGVPFVWLDYDAYRQASGNAPEYTQRRKQCAYNLYVAGMFEHSLAPLCRELGDRDQAAALEGIARNLVARTVDRFWSPAHRLFVDNLPWLAEEKTISLSDRALATAVLFDHCPGGDTAATLAALAACPAEMGLSHPQNAMWRLWALAQGGRIDVVLSDLRHRWANLPSVRLNNTLQEAWNTRPDTSSQWSHAAVAPLSVAHLYLAGMRPLAPGFRRVEIWPQLGDLRELALVTHTGQGPIRFQAAGRPGDRQLRIELPPGCAGELLVREGENVPLESLAAPAPPGYRRYRLPPGQASELSLRLT